MSHFLGYLTQESMILTQKGYLAHSEHVCLEYLHLVLLQVLKLGSRSISIQHHLRYSLKQLLFFLLQGGVHLKFKYFRSQTYIDQTCTIECHRTWSCTIIKASKIISEFMVSRPRRISSSWTFIRCEFAFLSISLFSSLLSLWGALYRRWVFSHCQYELLSSPTSNSWTWGRHHKSYSKSQASHLRKL